VTADGVFMWVFAHYGKTIIDSTAPESNCRECGIRGFGWSARRPSGGIEAGRNARKKEMAQEKQRRPRPAFPDCHNRRATSEAPSDDGSPATDEADKEQHERDDEQHVHERADGVGSNYSEQPCNQQNHREREQHMSSFIPWRVRRLAR